MPAVLDEDQLVQASRATVVEKLDSLVTADVLEPVDAPGLYNQSGLNGLNVCGTEGLQSVSPLSSQSCPPDHPPAARIVKSRGACPRVPLHKLPTRALVLRPAFGA